MKDTAEISLPASGRNPVFTIYGASNVGCVRENNEDAIYYDSVETLQNHQNEDVLMLIADGMGGHNAGEVASKLTVDTIRSARFQFGNDVHKSLVKAFTEANHKIFRTARRDSSLKGMGTTCTALVIRKRNAYCAHVGDSRLYLLRNGDIYRMTEDHTVFTENKKNSYIQTSLEDQEVESSLLTRALGIYRSVKVDTWSQGFTIMNNDRFLLCTDGLTDLVDDKDIKNVIMSFPLQEACHRLIELAKERGGYDNISMIAALVNA